VISSMNRTVCQWEKRIVWGHGSTGVQSLGGMLEATQFILPDGSQVSPFQIAPWHNEEKSTELDGILQRLRGEWPCVPFGPDEVENDPHGYGSNNHWTIDETDQLSLALHIDYPENHSIARLERTITPDQGAPALDFELKIIVRHDCQLPIGLHPVFKLPPQKGSFKIEVGDKDRVATFPGDLDASSIFNKDQVAPISAIPLRAGGVCDARSLPLDQNTEDLLQLIDVDGHVSLVNLIEKHRITLSWNKNHFPSTLFWISNKGRTAYPWLGRHLALGVEPICSAFDLGASISVAENSINKLGIPTIRNFKAGEIFVTSYRVEVTNLD
jgi:hypothetical protein